MEGGGEGPGEFGGIEGAEEGGGEFGLERGGKLIEAAAVDGGEAEAEAGEGKDVMAETAEHVFSLQRLVAEDGRAGVEGVEPGPAEKRDRGSRGGRKGGLSGAGEETEGRRERAKIGGGNEGEVHLKRGREKEDAIEPRAGGNVEVV